MRRGIALLTALMLLGGARFVMTFAVTAEIVVEAMSPQEIHDLGWETGPSTGLPVVGVGEQVYLKGRAATGEVVTGYTWTLEGPDSSAAVLGSADTEMVTFHPDVEGAYTVELTIMTAAGSATTRQLITAARYVGAGVFGVTAQASEGHCAACHPTQAAQWLATNHSTFFAEAIDGQQSSHYASYCIACHTVGYDPSAENGGFDDLAAERGWTFPTTLTAGNWEDMVQNYPEVANLANIQCENCHGPGSQHYGRRDGTAISLDEGVCGRCHEEEPYHTINLQWANSGHANGTSFAYAGTRSGCADCHSGYGFIAKVDPASNLGKTTGAVPVTCAVCHDPHPTTDVAEAGVHQLRHVEDVTLQNGVVLTRGGFGKHCMSCHQARRDAEEYAVPANASSHFGPHHSNQADMLAGTNVITFGRTLPNSTHFMAVENSCVGCHMAEGPAAEEPGHQALGGHAWAMTTEGVDHVAACRRCHGELESFDDIEAREDYDEDGQVESAKDEVHGLLEEVALLLPPVGQPEVVVTKDYTPLQMKAAYNYLFVEDDGSDGMHNFQFTVNLLRLTRDVLTYGVLYEGEIASVKDVPNDQGRQVQVAWTRFGGDGPSDLPIEVYYVWRRVDEASAVASKNLQVFDSFEKVPADPKLSNAAVQFGDELWTQVGTQPAARREQYAAVVPTLYDSTARGMHWSVFTVSGHTRESTVFVVSAPDSACSVDNLVPSAPSGITAHMQGQRVMLKWAPPADPDVDYVAIYRSTVPGFDPQGSQPVAALAETTEYTDTAILPGQTYYYRLAAVDFSGNRGAFSAEVSTDISTGIESLAGVPTEYELGQNYPNPFNPSTQIAFGVPEAGRVRIAVYSITGRQVGIVVDRHVAPGRYQATWDAGTLASGVYIYRMETPSHVSTRTMMLLK